MPLNVLVIGANGYLGSAISRAFLRSRPPPVPPPAPAPPSPHQTTTTTQPTSSPPPQTFRVYGLIRRASAAPALAAQEIIPLVGTLSGPASSPAALRDSIVRARLAPRRWDVIAVCTEPADRTAQARHWVDVLEFVGLLSTTNGDGGGGDEDAGRQQQHHRPLVLFSSGCKDYGTTGREGEAGLAPHTEGSGLAPFEMVRGRTEAAVRALAVGGGDDRAFDVVVLRATPICGYSGSYYGAMMEYVEGCAGAAAAAAAAGGGGKGDGVLKFAAHPGTILHGMHVDDCADAYVALARLALFGGAEGRRAVAGQVFNISGRRYETLREVGTVLAREYGFENGARFGVATAEIPSTVDAQGADMVFGWSQWVDSTKIRELTGWSDWRPLFSENLHVYRLSYEAARDYKDDNVQKIRNRMKGDWGSGD
ncbi:nad dependent epimerase dehydratase [Diplodia corticola]|uniref:Nad dependent epimerase dehydratase n=1 Tax=Diplodia corticola TaxID=236234 RepID=A0A1J9RHV6_9PEZI|nr:nad dependent epimerase dehydratase [Diplodia corticola]OJD32139.1 nad dependent epimerase dehydratase [Diplodia corticola]